MIPDEPPSNDPGAHNRAVMSALADGDASALAAGSQLWRDDADARAAWHGYHLIGDVLRSEELASSPRRDAAFLAALRTRLAEEPVVLAPPARVVAAPRHRWLAPAAVVAGFVAVAGVLVVARLSAGVDDAPVLASAPPLSGGFTRASVSTPVQPLVVEGRLIRDPRLDSYLRAHREAVGGAPVALPGNVPRSLDSESPVMSVALPMALPSAASR